MANENFTSIGSFVSEDQGTDAPVLTTEDSQGVSYNQRVNVGQGVLDAQAASGTDSTAFTDTQQAGLLSSGVPFRDFAEPKSLGVGAPGDDNSNGPNTRAGTERIINATNNSSISPSPNVLDQYASYTYSLSWYLLTPQQFNQLKYGKPNVAGWTLLVQSGGAQANVGGTGNGGRSPYFAMDYYLDNLRLESQYPGGGGGTMMAHNVNKLEFTVAEPTGITLPNALAEAVKDLYKKTAQAPKVSYNLATFAMVIHFYGYDSAGNLVTAGRKGNITGNTTAFVEKIYPFLVSSLNYRLSTKGIEYKVNGTVVAYQVQGSAKRGSIPGQFELVGTTTKDILSGNGGVGQQVTVAQDGRQSTTTAPATPEPPYARSALGNAVVTGGYSEQTGMDFGQLSG